MRVLSDIKADLDTLARERSAIAARGAELHRRRDFADPRWVKEEFEALWARTDRLEQDTEKLKEEWERYMRAHYSN
jgi:hypothetical protein